MMRCDAIRYGATIRYDIPYPIHRGIMAFGIEWAVHDSLLFRAMCVWLCVRVWCPFLATGDRHPWEAF